MSKNDFVDDLKQEYLSTKSLVNSKIARAWNRNSTVGILDIKKDIPKIESIFTSLTNGYFCNIGFVEFKKILELNIDNKLNRNPETPCSKKENFKKYILKDAVCFYKLLEVKNSLLQYGESLEERAKVIKKIVA